MTDYEWAVIGSDVRHAVPPDGSVTLCGLPLDSERKQTWTDTLGRERPCDNCTEIIARRADVGVPA